jgi:hypothetical protein
MAGAACVNLAAMRPSRSMAAGSYPSTRVLWHGRVRWHRPFHPFSDASSIIHRLSSSNVMPACAAISGTSDVPAMPDCVLTARQLNPLRPLDAVAVAQVRTAHTPAAERAMRRKRLVFGPVGKQSVKRGAARRVFCEALGQFGRRL